MCVDKYIVIMEPVNLSWFLFFYLKMSIKMSTNLKYTLLDKLLHIFFLEKNEEIKKELEVVIELIAYTL